MSRPDVAPGEFTDVDRFIFESWGYLVIPDVLSTDEIEACYEASVRLHSDSASGFAQLGRSYEREPALERLMDHPAVLPKIRGLYNDVFLLQSAWNSRMRPGHGKVEGWHQDGSASSNFKELGYPIPLIQLRVSYLLTDQSSSGMGNLQLIPGSHRSRIGVPQAVLESGADLPISHVLCASAGSVLLFHNAVWHRSYELRGTRDRYTQHYIYSPPWVRSADRLQNSSEFLERTTPLRRALMGEFLEADAPFGGTFHPLPFED
jgi:ectoine hydroxylase